MRNKKFKNIFSTIQNVGYVLKIIHEFEKKYIIIPFLNIIITILPFASLIASQQILNNIQIGVTSFNSILVLIFIYFIIQLIQVTFGIFYNYILSKYSEYISCEMVKNFDSKSVYLSLKDFENDKIYDMITRAEGQMGVRGNSIIKNLLTVFQNIIGLVCSAYILARWHISIIICFLLLPILSFIFFKKISDIEYKIMFNRAVKQRKAWYYSYLLTKDYNIKEVRTLNLSNYVVEQKKIIQDQLYEENVHLLNLKTIFKSCYQIITLFFSVLLILFAIIEAIQGRIFIGNLTTYITTTSRIEKYVSGLTDSSFALYSDGLYSRYIINFFEYVNSKKQIKNKLIFNQDIETIELRNVSYKYKNSNRYALKNINLTIKKDDIVAFVGENGSGKSTLIKIIVGLYDDYFGKVLINGIDLKEIDIETYRNKISAIFQDYNKYELTVKENIMFGDIYTQHSDFEFEKASNLVGADEFISKLPGQYNQQVGSWFANGIQLSGGQWQKLALARANIKNADVYIFDEPTSSLDPSSEYLFFENMINSFKDKIGVFVTHRFTNVKLANKIYVFKDGGIVEEGNHQQLIGNQGLYAHLYNLQINGIKNEKSN